MEEIIYIVVVVNNDNILRRLEILDWFELCDSFVEFSVVVLFIW